MSDIYNKSLEKTPTGAGEMMQKMRKEGKSDMEVAFVGMAYVIDGAISLIQDAVSTINKVKTPDWTWIMQPWKFNEQTNLESEIDKQVDAIEKFNSQLQNSISVASYAISLEQLENALNASSLLEAPKMRCFSKF